MALRLDKYLTELGAGTRSEVKKQIKAGLVTVNGAVAKKPEQKVDETGDEVCLRGERLLYTAFEYYLFHKPAGWCVGDTGQYAPHGDGLSERHRKRRSGSRWEGWISTPRDCF